MYLVNDQVYKKLIRSNEECTKNALTGVNSNTNSININNGEIFGLTESRDSFYFTSSEMEYSNSAKTDGYDLILDNLVGQIEYSEEDILYAKSPKAKYWFMKKKIFRMEYGLRYLI